MELRNCDREFAHRGSHFSPSSTVEVVSNFLSPTFVPCCGIFTHTRSHLTNLGEVAGFAVRARSLRLRSGQVLRFA
jgi:hypothetical protein